MTDPVPEPVLSAEIRAALDAMQRWRGHYVAAYEAVTAARSALGTAITGWRKGDLVEWTLYAKPNTVRRGVIARVTTDEDDSTRPHEVLLHLLPLDPHALPRNGWYLRGDAELTRSSLSPGFPT